MAIRAKPRGGEPAIHDRQVDYIVGVPLLIASLAINVLLPVRLSAMFWVWRIDLLALPLFVAGAICVLFGVRTLWRLRLAVLFLILAWPLPYTALLMTQLENFTDLTLAAVRGVLHVMPVAHQVPGADNSMFQIEHGARGFPVSVATACSGVNGMVGYALLSAAFLAVVRGPLIRKVAWLVVGLVVIWMFNVAAHHDDLRDRQAVGRVRGDRGIPPLPRAGDVQLGCGRHARAAPVLPPRDLSGPEASGSSRSASPTARRAVPRTRLAVMVVVAVALLSGVANASLRGFDLVAGADGTPKLAAFLTDPAEPEGWKARQVASYSWTAPVLRRRLGVVPLQLHGCRGGARGWAPHVVADRRGRDLDE